MTAAEQAAHERHEDSRSEAFRERRHAAQETAERLILSERWRHGVEALLSTACGPSDDFDGCTQ